MRAARRARRAAWRADCPPLVQAGAAQPGGRARRASRGRAPPRAAAPRGGGAGLLPARDARRPRSGARRRRGASASTSWRTAGSSSSSTSTASPTGSAAARRRRRRPGRFAACTAGVFGGPETISCPSCHWVGGPNGAGAETDNAFLERRRRAHGERRRAQPAGAGRARRRPGAGARDEPRPAAAARRPRARRRTRRRRARGAPGRARASTSACCASTPTGEVDTSGVRGVDADLVVKPFGWKGTLADVRGLRRRGAAGPPRHPERRAPRERRRAERRSARAATTRRSRRRRRARRARPRSLRGDDGAPGAARDADRRAADPGPPARPRPRRRCCRRRRRASPTTSSAAARQFHELGCAGCHVPMMVLESPIARPSTGCRRSTSSREMRQPALRYDPTPRRLSGVALQRSQAPRHGRRPTPPGTCSAASRSSEYLTPRLWGVADSAPYLHDGRAPSFDYAIAGHDGEGAAARAAFAALPLAGAGARCAST